MAKYLEEYKKIFQGGKFLRSGEKTSLDDYRAFDGGCSRSLYDLVLDELKHRFSVTVLDFGCGEGLQWHKQTLINKTTSLPNLLGDKLQGFFRYDPGYSIYEKKPTGKFDFIICADVLEHIPDDELDNLFKEINSYTYSDSVVFYSISTLPSKNSFLDGTNMHVNIKPPSEWSLILKKHSKTKTYAIFDQKQHRY